MSTIRDLSDEDVQQLVIAGQIIFAHKAICAGYMTLEESAAVMGAEPSYIRRQFHRLGLEAVEEMTFEDMLTQAPAKEVTYTAEEIRKIFFSDTDE